MLSLNGLLCVIGILIILSVIIKAKIVSLLIKIAIIACAVAAILYYAMMWGSIK